MESNILARCESMCPREEIYFRIEHNLVHSLEIDPQTKMPDGKRMVKEYRRSAAGADHLNPAFIRTPHALLATIEYLYRLYKNTVDEGFFAKAYTFVCDRLRAVRQDMILQRCSGSDTQKIIERMIPFYVVTEYVCIDEACKEYNWKLHSTQLEECFSRWSEVYKLPEADRRSTGPRDDIILAHFLRQLDSQRVFEKLIRWKRRGFMSRALSKRIKRIALAYRLGNFQGFFRLVATLNDVPKASVSLQVARLRIKALSIFSLAYRAPNVKLSLPFLCKALCFDENMIREFLDHFNVAIDDDCIYPIDIPPLPSNPIGAENRSRILIALSDFQPCFV